MTQNAGFAMRDLDKCQDSLCATFLLQTTHRFVAAVFFNIAGIVSK